VNEVTGIWQKLQEMRKTGSNPSKSPVAAGIIESAQIQEDAVTPKKVIMPFQVQSATPSAQSPQFGPQGPKSVSYSDKHCGYSPGRAKAFRDVAIRKPLSDRNLFGTQAMVAEDKKSAVEGEQYPLRFTNQSYNINTDSDVSLSFDVGTSDTENDGSVLRDSKLEFSECRSIEHGRNIKVAGKEAWDGDNMSHSSEEESTCVDHYFGESTTTTTGIGSTTSVTVGIINEASNEKSSNNETTEDLKQLPLESPETSQSSHSQKKYVSPSQTKSGSISTPVSQSPAKSVSPDPVAQQLPALNTEDGVEHLQRAKPSIAGSPGLAAMDPFDIGEDDLADINLTANSKENFEQENENDLINNALDLLELSGSLHRQVPLSPLD